MATEQKVGRGGVSRHLALFKNADVDRWFRNLRAGSEKIAKVWLAAVGRFLEWADLKPQGLLAKTGDAATRLLEDYRDAFQDKSSGTDLVIKAVKSLLQRKGIALTQKIEVKRLPRAHDFSRHHDVKRSKSSSEPGDRVRVHVGHPPGDGLKEPVRAGDFIFDAVHGEWVLVSSLQVVADRTKVYDILTDGPNNFIANGFLLDRKLP